MTTGKAADRYLRQGTVVPQIYPGDLAGLTAALFDTEVLSRRVPGQHTLSLVHGGVRAAFRTFEDGLLTWQYEAEAGSLLPRGSRNTAVHYTVTRILWRNA